MMRMEDNATQSLSSSSSSSSSTAAAFQTILNSIEALGRGFDVNFDTRLLYCKGAKLVEIDDHTRDILASHAILLPDISKDIKCYQQQETLGRQSSGICSFQEMVGYFNKKADLLGNAPLGSFNSAFSFTGSKKTDEATTKSLSMDGFFVPLCKVQIKNPSVLLENIKQAIPSSWDPSALARFIENFGTHVITSVTVGGKDVIYVKHHNLSPLSTMEIKNYVQDIGNRRFLSAENYANSGPMKFNDKAADPYLFNNQGIYPHSHSASGPYLTGREDVTVIFRRRGGDDLVQNHIQWVKTVKDYPDVIEMTFFPITALLDGIPCKDHLSRAINLYLEYKPPIEELQYFLEFQCPLIWAPVEDKFLGHQRKEPVFPSLQFSIMGQKLYVSQEQVTVGRKPVTGFRLCLEGTKQNRLCIQLQYLASLPKILRPYWDTNVGIGAPKWQGPEEQDSRWFEAVKWKNFSHVCTAPIENNETFIGALSGVCIVTGAQLGVWEFGPRNVLHMKLLYSRIPGCTIRRSFWDHTPSCKSGKSKKIIKLEDGTSPPENSSSGSKDGIGNKLGKLVDMSEMSKGPQDSPGHWLVTGGKLGVEKGRIVLRVKYSLLNY